MMGMEKLKKASLYYIASHLSKSEVGELEQIFMEIDQNGDGRISLQELDSALSNRKCFLLLKVI